MNRSHSVRRTKFLTYRIDEIPSKYDTKEKLLQCFHSDDKVYVDVKSFVPSISDPESGEHTATIQYQNEGKPRLDVAAENIDLDADFQGFTPLNETDENVAADIIAVTGLGGHAFGSWVNSRGHMWLRDYLPKDLMNRARILVYGYPSALLKSHSRRSLGDYSDGFMQDLMGIRSQLGIQNRPIIFIGHSLGGLIVKKALSDLGPDVLSRMPIRSILFFGAPHAGLDNRALQTMVAGQANENLIRDLGDNSSMLDDLVKSFDSIANSIKIYSFVETQETPVVEEIDGKWQRGSHRVMMVSKQSARVRCRTETVRWVNSDHSEMVKLRKGQGSDYPYIVSIIKEALRSAGEKWEGSSKLRDTENSEPPVEQSPRRGGPPGWFSPDKQPDFQRAPTPQPVPQSNVGENYFTTPEREEESYSNAELRNTVENEDARSAPPPEYTETPASEEHGSEDASQPEPLTRLQELRFQLEEMQSFTNISNPAVQQAMMELARLLFEEGRKQDLQEAEDIVRRLLRHHENSSWSFHPDALNCLEFLAEILEEQDKSHDAESFYSLLYRRSRQAYGETAEVVLKNAAKLVELHLRQDNSEEAEDLCREILHHRLNTFGPSHRKTVDCQVRLAECLSQKGEWPEAKDLLEECYGSLTMMINEDDWDLLEPTQLLARACEQVGQYDRSEHLYRAALVLLDDDDYHLNALQGRMDLAGVLDKQGKHTEAHFMVTGILSEVGDYEFSDLERYGVSAPQLLCFAGKQLSQMVQADGYLFNAEQTLFRALGDENFGHLSDFETLIETPRFLGRVYKSMGNLAQAESFLVDALNKCAEKGVDSLRGPILLDLALTHEAQRHFNKAIMAYQNAAEAFRREGDVLASFGATSNLAQIHLQLNDHANAEWTLRGLLDQQMAALPENHDHVLGTMNRLANVYDAVGRYPHAADLRAKMHAAVQNAAEFQDFHNDEEEEEPEDVAAEFLTLPVYIPTDMTFREVHDVLYTLGISCTTAEESAGLLVLDCWEQSQSLKLTVKASGNVMDLALSSTSSVSLKHVMSSIQRLLAPTLVGNRQNTYVYLVDVNSAETVVRLSEQMLRRREIVVGLREGPATQSLHRCQLKRTHFFKPNQKVSFHMTHEIVPRHGNVMDVSFQWVQGDRELFTEVVGEIIQELGYYKEESDDEDEDEDDDDDDDEEEEDVQNGPQFDYNANRRQY